MGTLRFEKLRSVTVDTPCSSNWIRISVFLQPVILATPFYFIPEQIQLLFCSPASSFSSVVCSLSSCPSSCPSTLQPLVSSPALASHQYCSIDRSSSSGAALSQLGEHSFLEATTAPATCHDPISPLKMVGSRAER